jgi:type VI secretion system protein ImpJ
MNKLQRVVWSKGMFLTPQHFQAQDEYFDDLLQFRLTASNFANWGFIGLDIDEASLANGLFTIRHCQGVLPDGLTFNVPEADNAPEGRPIEEFFPPTQATLDVFLAIPEYRPKGRNFTLSTGANGAQPATRFVSETRTLTDETLGTDEKDIQLARKTLRLVLEGENLDGLTVMRVAQVTRKQSGSYILNQKFIPPLLNISANEFLMNLVRRQIEVLSAKSGSLALPRREKGRGLADFTTSEVASFWLLHTVNSYMPELLHIWKVRRGHPDVLFRAMLRLAGALSTFSIEARVKDLVDYDHDNLGPCFIELDDRIRDLLETVLPSKCIVIPLSLTDKLIWSGSIPDDQYLKNSQWFVSVSSRIAVDELINKFPRLARVSSPADIQLLIRKSVDGIPLRHAPAPPAAIPLKLDNQYFSLSKRGALWEGVAQSRMLSVFVPAEIAEPKMELLVVLE